MSAEPDALRHIWAKSPRGTAPAETLTAHTQAVLDRLAGWRQRYPLLPQHASCPALWDLAAWACLLHDLGKVALGFQQRLRGGQPFVHRHEVLSLVVVGWLEVPDEVRGLIGAAVATHHKDLPVLRARYPFGGSDRDDLLAHLSPEDEEAWELWLAGSGAPNLVSLGFSPLPPLRRQPRANAMAASFAALSQLDERLGDEPATAPLATAACFMRGLLLLADHAASAGATLNEAPLLHSVSSFLGHNESRFSRGLEPHQVACADICGDALLVAPTGSGKTEAALLWAARQQEEPGGHRTIFYVLPFRASLNAMRRRIPTYGVDDAQVVLQHASATASLYRYFLDERELAAGEAAHAARKEWSLGRLMTAPVRVLTPYQLLRAFFGLRAHEAVLTDAAGGLFVLDELHAYDLDRLALILAAVGDLSHRLGARFFAMSATFPSVLRVALRSVLATTAHEIVATAETFERFRRHRLTIWPEDLTAPATISDIVRRRREGEAVLVVATTVRRAQALFDLLSQESPPQSVTLLHSRYTAADRSAKELELATRIGTGHRSSQAAGTILVATQVVEVSLDVDFDALYTDPAPLEALIQRFGRVNRGLRGGLRPVVVCSGSASDGCGVYSPDLVARALNTLAPLADAAIDEALLGSLVDSIYEPIAPAWLEELDRRVRRVRDAVIRTNRPLSSHPELEELFERLFDGCEVVPACKEQEYRALEQREPIEAAFLRVPISERQRAQLLRTGRLLGEVAHVPYDSVRGLAL